MRTKTMLAAAAALAAGLATSMAQSNVYSVNVVGYVNKVFVGGNKYTGVANPLNTTNNTLSGLFGGAGTGLPSGSRVLKWIPGAADFTTYTKIPSGNGWLPAAGATATLNPGEGCLVQIGGANYTNTFVGEVLQGSLTNSTLAGYQLIGNQVPDSGTATALALNPPNGSRVLKWDTTLQDWVIYTKTPTIWLPSTPSIDVGEGFMLQAASDYAWVRNFTVGP